MLDFRNLDDIKDSDIIETIQRLLIVSNKISQGKII